MPPATKIGVVWEISTPLTALTCTVSVLSWVAVCFLPPPPRGPALTGIFCSKPLKVAGSVPGLTLTLDPSHYLVQGLSLDDLKPLLPHVAHVHLRDAAPGLENLQVPCGQGDLRLSSLMEMLGEAGYDGGYGVEITRTDNWQIRPADAPAEARKMGEQARSHLP